MDKEVKCLSYEAGTCNMLKQCIKSGHYPCDIEKIKQLKQQIHQSNQENELLHMRLNACNTANSGIQELYNQSQQNLKVAVEALNTITNENKD